MRDVPLSTTRRSALLSAATTILIATPSPSPAANQVVAPGFEPSRVEGIGGGADLLSNAAPAIADVVYPPFLNGTWRCERVITDIGGDVGQAKGAWRLLGGYGDVGQPESYSVRFIDTRDANPSPIVGLDGRTYFGVVLDRGYEFDQRAHGAQIQWSAASPNTLSYSRDEGGRGSAAELRVVQRSVELPQESNDGTRQLGGWGSDELYRVTTSTAITGEIYYCARVKRRWRRGVTEDGGRLVEGLEIVKTYRVLDGVAGVEYPTSTTKSMIRLVRS